MPLAHGIHYVAPVPLVYFPLGHAIHSNDPYVFDYEFFGQSSQLASPVSLLNVPGLHLVHASAAEIPSCLIPYVPTGHSWHFVCSVLLFYYPWWQRLHIDAPLSSWYLPLGQSSGSSNPYFVHLLPLGHGKQSVLSSDPVDGI